MILQNFDSILQHLISGYSHPLSELSEEAWRTGAPGVVKSTKGVIYRFRSSVALSQNYGLFGGGSSVTDNYNSPNNNYPVMLVGSGDADEAYNDYEMAYLSDLSVVGFRAANTSYTTEGCTLTLAKTFVNNTENDITVNEVGMYLPISANQTGSSTNYSTSVMICREKLSAPVTLTANGGKATFSLTINIPLMNKPDE